MAAVEAMSNPKGQDQKSAKSDESVSKIAPADSKSTVDPADKQKDAEA